jgi:DNA-binding NarL/FixJ family response regulator
MEGLTIRVLIGDDSDLFRQALASFVAELPDMLVVGVAPSGEEALRLADRLRPDVVLLDVFMPGIGGLGAARDLMRLEHPPGIVMVTTSHDPQLREEALRVGAHALVLKCDVGARIEAVIRAAVRPMSACRRASAQGLAPAGHEENGDGRDL